MSLIEAAEQLVTEWADHTTSLHGPYELALVEWVLAKLADPSSSYGPALEDVCQRRWFVGQVA